MLFADLKLAEPILRVLEAQNYTAATPIQAQAIPHAIAGRDILGCAQTGTGKTAAFALPTLHRLALSAPAKPEPAAAPDATLQGAQEHAQRSRHHRGRGGHRGHRPQHAGPDRLPRALVLGPTRELVAQIHESFQTYGSGLGLRYAVIYGGVGQFPQVDALRRGVDVVIATPGRLLDLVEQGHADLSRVETFILDEADRMLDMGFIHDMRRIAELLREQRQTLLFSATMPKEIRWLAHDLLRDPVSIQIEPERPAADKIEQAVYHVPQPRKRDVLAQLVHELNMSRAIVFTRTKHGADRLVKHLEHRDIHAAAIHGDKPQNTRQRALAAFHAGKLNLLVATDIASRGIDVDGISHVVNFDVPRDAESYVHRIGRTARAGASGVAVTLCDPEELGLVRAIERLIRKPIPVRPTPTASANHDLPVHVETPGELRDDLAPANDTHGTDRPTQPARKFTHDRPRDPHFKRGFQGKPKWNKFKDQRPRQHDGKSFTAKPHRPADGAPQGISPAPRPHPQAKPVSHTHQPHAASPHKAPHHAKPAPPASSHSHPSQPRPAHAQPHAAKPQHPHAPRPSGHVVPHAKPQHPHAKPQHPHAQSQHGGHASQPAGKPASHPGKPHFGKPSGKHRPFKKFNKPKPHGNTF